MTAVTVSPKYQIVIPKEIRESIDRFVTPQIPNRGRMPQP
ncbi:MAG: AbrB/MazE/SpoVT family DNA-binding domain-containing protein [Candidatus Thiodiazotropha sp.]|jgi:hypothetical protein